MTWEFLEFSELFFYWKTRGIGSRDRRPSSWYPVHWLTNFIIMWAVHAVIYGLDLIRANHYPWSNHICRVLDGRVRSDQREAAARSGHSAAFHGCPARAHWSSAPKRFEARRCVISSSKRCSKPGDPYPKRVAAWGDGKGGARQWLLLHNPWRRRVAPPVHLWLQEQHVQLPSALLVLLLPSIPPKMLRVHPAWRFDRGLGFAVCG
jgi:hypothetical protein